MPVGALEIGEGALDQAHGGVGEPRIKQLRDPADGRIHTADPVVHVAPADEPAGVERSGEVGVVAAQVRCPAALGGDPQLEVAAQLAAAARRVHQQAYQVGRLVPGQPAAQLRVGDRITARGVGEAREATLLGGGEARGHEVLAEAAVLGVGARARPRERAALVGETHSVGHPAVHGGREPVAAHLAQFAPAVVGVVASAVEHHRVGRSPQHVLGQPRRAAHHGITVALLSSMRRSYATADAAVQPDSGDGVARPCLCRLSASGASRGSAPSPRR